jgi:hypothetical protein
MSDEGGGLREEIKNEEIKNEIKSEEQDGNLGR